MENTATTNNNPLSKYFRQPAIYTKLPSNGQFWPEGSLDLTVTGEIPVYPMTAKDEVTLRTPDALMNGSGVVDVIHSCCPNINDAWKMPSIDVDAVLIAIRIASYGHEMTVDTSCPYCKEENSHTVDLRVSLSSIHAPDYNNTVNVENLKIKIRPQPYFGVNRGNAIGFEEQKIIKAIEQSDLDADGRTKLIAESMKRLLEIGIDTVTTSTEYIELSDGSRVADQEYIKEFYNNADGAAVRAIQQKLSELNQEGAIPPQRAPCSNVECGKEYEIPLIFDYANFFANGS